MGKKHQDRVKGSFQPSNSSRAAELLQGAGTNVLSFSSFGFGGTAHSNSGYSSPNLSASEFGNAPSDYYGLDNELVVVLKNLNKRNTTTKLKALEEVSNIIEKYDEISTLTFFDHWCSLYPKLSIDINRRVRLITNQILSTLVQKIGKKLTNYLKKISGAWVTSMFDPSKEVANLAQTCLNNTFPNDKTVKMLQFTHHETFDYIQNNILYQSLDSLADPRFYTPEEQMQKYSRVITSSLDAWGYLIETLPLSHIQEYEYQYKTVLDSKTFWEFYTYESAAIRSSAYRFLIKFVSYWKDGANEYLNNLASAFLSKCFNEKDSSTHRDMWSAILVLTKELPDIWTMTKKPGLPKLLQYLKAKCYGSQQIALPALIVLIDNLPTQIKSPLSEFYPKLVDAIFSGSNAITTTAINDKKPLTITTISELLLHGLSIGMKQEDWEVTSNILINQLGFKLVEASFSDQYHPSTRISAKFLVDLTNLIKKTHPESDLIQPLLTQCQTLITGFLNDQSPSQTELTFNQQMALKISDFISQLCLWNPQPPLSNATDTLIQSLFRDFEMKFKDESITSESYADFCTLGHNLITANHDHSKTIVSMLDNSIENHIQREPTATLELITYALRCTQYFDNTEIFKILENVLKSIENLEIDNQIQCLILLLGKFKTKQLNSICVPALENLILNIFKNQANTFAVESELSSQMIRLISLALSTSDLVLSTNYHQKQFVSIDQMIDSNLHKILNHDQNDSYDQIIIELIQILEILLNVELSNFHSNTLISLITQSIPSNEQNESNLLSRIVRLASIDLKTAQHPSPFDKSNQVLQSWFTYFLQIKNENYSLEFLKEIVQSYKNNLLNPMGYELHDDACIKLLSLLNQFTSEFPQHDDIYMKIIPSPTDLQSLVNLKEFDLNKKFDSLSEHMDILGLYLFTQNNQTTTITNQQPLVDIETLDSSITFLYQYFDEIEVKHIKLSLLSLTEITSCLILGKVALPNSLPDVDKVIIKLVLSTFIEFSSEFPKVLFEAYEQLGNSNFMIIPSTFNIWNHYLEIFKTDIASNEQTIETLIDHLNTITHKDAFFGNSLFSIFSSIFDNSTSLKHHRNQLSNSLNIEKLTHGEFDKQQLDSLTNIAFMKNALLPLNTSQSLFDNTCNIFAHTLEHISKDSNHHDHLSILIMTSLMLMNEMLPNISLNFQRHNHLAQTLPSLLKSDLSTTLNNEPLKIMMIHYLGMNLINHLDQLRKTRSSFDLFWDLIDKPSSENLLALFIQENYYLNDPINEIRKNYLNQLCLAAPSINPLILKGNPPVNQLCNLLKSPYQNLTRNSYLLVRRAIAFQLLKVKEQLDQNKEIESSKVLTIPSFLFSSLNFDNFNASDNFSQASFSYLLSWMAMIDYLEVMDLNLKNYFLELIKENSILDNFILFLIDILNIQGNKPFDCSIWDITKVTIRGLQNSLELGLPLLASNLYFRLLRTLPSSVRQWWNSCTNRKLISDFESYTEKYFSKILIQTEIMAISDTQSINGLQDENFIVKVLRNEIYGQYIIDENAIDITVKIPNSFPLHQVQVDGKQHSGVPENRWRAWLLNTSGVFVSQNGTVADAISLFKKNVQLHFEGVEDCTICYSVIGVIDRSLPNRQCKTCKNKFHSACLFKWFRTSNQSSCPLCRNIF